MPEAPESQRTRLVRVDSSVYSLTAVLKSCYRITDRGFVHLQRSEKGRIEVRLRPKASADDPEQLAGDFLNDLIDQGLRECLAAETQAARDLILAHALSKAKILPGAPP